MEKMKAINQSIWW